MTAATPTVRVRSTPAAAGLAAGIGLTLVAVLGAGAGQPHAAIPRWEYATFESRQGGGSVLVQSNRRFVGNDEIAAAMGLSRREQAAATSGVILDALGAAGWEMVAVEREEDPETVRLYFKRPV